MVAAPIDVNHFDDIRPYTDEEIPPAIERLLKEPIFYKMMKWVYPNLSKSVIQEMIHSIKTVDEFQEQLGAPAIKVVTQLTTSGLSFTNMESLQKDVAYLFISNHRDIILDSALLNVHLLEKGFRTTQIAIGDNLLKTQMVQDLVRANKNFIVNRNVHSKEIFHYSLRLSNYIHQTIVNDNTSIWIAQREGRSKDGDDRTSSALLKMFAMSSARPVEDALHELHIIPMAVSYEYDPCDLMKAGELIQMRLFGTYDKQQGEDFRSMLRGLTGHKGRINIAMGEPMTKAIEEMRNIAHKNEKAFHLAHSIDREMHRIYKLWPTNYIAYDILHGVRECRGHYTNIQRITFANYIRGHLIRLSMMRKKWGLPKEGFSKIAKEILLEMYANPVANKLAVNRDALSYRS